MSLHWSFHKGSKVRIILKDGTVIITKYKMTDNQILVTEAGRFRKRQVSSCCYYKPLPHEIKKEHK